MAIAVQLLTSTLVLFLVYFIVAHDIDMDKLSEQAAGPLLVCTALFWASLVTPDLPLSTEIHDFLTTYNFSAASDREFFDGGTTFTLQLGLSFGHTHAEVALAGISAGQSQASTPDTDHDQDVHRDLCAICATMAMANTLVASAPPSLPVQLTATARQSILDPEVITTDSRRGAFRSRAPPLS